MAVTINTSPSLYTPAYNQMIYNVSTNNSAQSNFQFIADVYINASSTASARLKFPCKPSTSYNFVDIMGVVKSYVSSDVYTPGQKGFKTNDNSIVSVQVQFGEEYGASSGVVAYPNLTASTTIYAFDASLAYTDFVAYDYTQYTTTTTANARKILSTMPTTNYIGSSENYWLYLLNNGNGVNQYNYSCVIIAYDSNGATLNTTAFQNPYYLGNTTVKKHVRLGVGTYDLAQLTNPDLSLGSVPCLPASTSYYEVRLTNDAGSGTAPVYRFNINDKCHKSTIAYRLCWLNTLGGYDSFTFYGQYKRKSTIERKMYKKLAGYFSGANWTLDNQNSRQNSQYSTVVQDSYHLVSDWISEAQSTWLEELFSSPAVFAVRPAGGTNMIPVNITNSDYEFMTESGDKLFNVEFDMTFDFERTRQQL